MAHADAGRPVLYLAPPDRLVELWREWSGTPPGLQRRTITISRALARYLAHEMPASVDHRVIRLWDMAWGLRPEDMPFIPYNALPDLLASDLREALPPAWRGPGAAEAAVEAAILLRRHEVHADSLDSVPARWRGPLALAAGRLDAVLRRGFDEVRLYRYAAGALRAPGQGGAAAIFGMMDPHPAQAGLLAALAERMPTHVFVPWTNSPEDAYVRPWVSWWEQRNARVEVRTGGPVHRVGVRAPGSGLSAMAAVLEGEAASCPDARDWAVGAATPEDAGRVARWLSGEGVPVRLDPGPARPAERFRTALRAARQDAPAAAVLAWLAASSHAVGASDREAVIRASRRPSVWPAPVRERHQLLIRRREELLGAPDWEEALSRTARFAAAAGVELPVGDEESERVLGFDRAQIPTSAGGITAWLEGAAHTVPGQAEGAWVSTLWELRGSFHSRLVLTRLDAESIGPAPEWETGPAAGWLDAARPERAARRDLAVRHLQRLLGLSAGRIYVLGSPDHPWPANLELKTVWDSRPPGSGPGLPVSRERRASRFGVYDGRFPEDFLPRPRSASDYEAFGRCPLRFAWTKLGAAPLDVPGPEPDPAQTGTWAHRALQRIVEDWSERPEPAALAARVARVLAEVMAEDRAPEDVPGDVASAVAESLAEDLTWYLLDDWPHRFAEGEVVFTIELEGRSLKGSIDRVERAESSELRVVDYKTGRLPKADPSPTALQLPIYAEAASRRYGVPVDQVRARYQGIRDRNGFRSVPLVEPTGARLQETLEVLAGIDERLGRGEAFLFPQEGACRSCEFRPACTWEAPRDAVLKARSHPEFAALWEAKTKDGRGGSPL